MYVVVAGAGKVGYYLSKTLIEAGHEVLLVEKDRHKCAIISDELGEILYQGDACEMAVLQEIGIERADVVVAVTGDDEDNLVICQLAKEQFRVPTTVSRVNNPKNEEIFHRIGIDRIINATTILFHLVEEEMETEAFLPLLALHKGEVQVIEVHLPENAPVVGKAIKEVGVLEDVVFATVMRAGKLLFPKGSTVFQSGDTVVAFTRPQREEELRRLLLGT